MLPLWSGAQSFTIQPLSGGPHRPHRRERAPAGGTGTTQAPASHPALAPSQLRVRLKAAASSEKF